MKPEAVHRSPSIFLKNEQTLEKTSARRSSDEGCATIHSLKWGPLPPNDVGMLAQNVRGEKGRKERIRF